LQIGGVLDELDVPINGVGQRVARVRARDAADLGLGLHLVGHDRLWIHSHKRKLVQKQFVGQSYTTPSELFMVAMRVQKYWRGGFP
jgi:hypothetical protein